MQPPWGCQASISHELAQSERQKSGWWTEICSTNPLSWGLGVGGESSPPTLIVAKRPAARPATGIPNPEPRNSSKETKNNPLGPRPRTPKKKTQKILKIPEKYIFSGIFCIFEYLRSLRSGPGRSFFIFWEEFRGSGFWIPVAGRAVLKL